MRPAEHGDGRGDGRSRRSWWLFHRQPHCAVLCGSPRCLPLTQHPEGSQRRAETSQQKESLGGLLLDAVCRQRGALKTAWGPGVHGLGLFPRQHDGSVGLPPALHRHRPPGAAACRALPQPALRLRPQPRPRGFDCPRRVAEGTGGAGAQRLACSHSVQCAGAFTINLLSQAWGGGPCLCRVSSRQGEKQHLSFCAFPTRLEIPGYQVLFKLVNAAATSHIPDFRTVFSPHSPSREANRPFSSPLSNEKLQAGGAGLASCVQVSLLQCEDYSLCPPLTPPPALGTFPRLRLQTDAVSKPSASRGCCRAA